MKFIFFCSLIFTLPLFAKEHNGPCKADVEKFCAEVEPGEGRIVKCLKENEAKLSEECKKNKEHMKEEIKAKVHEVKEACSEDIKKLCPSEKPGKGRVLHCLKDNEASLSKECKESLPTKKWKKDLKNK